MSDMHSDAGDVGAGSPRPSLESADEPYVGMDGASFERDLVVAGGPCVAEAAGALCAAVNEECARLGLRVERLGSPAGLTVGQIANMVRRAEFLLLDLTGRQAEVFYALGYAHGVGNEALDVLLVLQEGAVPGLDMSPLRVKLYRSPEHLRSIVATGLSDMIQHTRA